MNLYLLNTPKTIPIYQKIFNFVPYPSVLLDYENILRGGGARVWDMIEHEYRHQRFMSQKKRE